jgi:molybdate transport system permease protein
MVAGNIPGRTRTVALAIFHDSQVGRDDRAAVLAGVTVAMAFAALWTTELLARRLGRRREE